jgi:hypothetical protein
MMNDPSNLPTPSATPERYHLAQLNIAQARVPLHAPEMVGFTDGIGPMNALADASAGFVWRLQDSDAATEQRLFGENMLVTMSVWADVAALHHFVYKSAHVGFVRQRQDWFVPLREASVVLWWLPAGTWPSLEEARARLDLLRANGPSPQAFTLHKSFEPGWEASLGLPCTR